MDSEKMRAFFWEQRKKVQNLGLALKDIRVIDLGAVVAAPYAATMLGDFGAEVIKIEPREVPDAIRFWSVVEEKHQPYWLVNSGDPDTMVDSVMDGQTNLSEAGTDVEIEEAAADKGYHATDTMELADWLSASGAPFLAKPYTPAELVAAAALVIRSTRTPRP